MKALIPPLTLSVNMNMNEPPLMKRPSHMRTNWRLNPSKWISDSVTWKLTQKKPNNKKYKRLKHPSFNSFIKKESLLATHKKCGHLIIESCKKRHMTFFRTEVTVASWNQVLHYYTEGFKRISTYQYEEGNSLT